ncbi:MAG: amino acid-binding protein [Firmicutes bacterium HGW-Firmicutes-7]|nr:MAG: amino acid-binding protein [Firmicutes bacterium HGW-Firmicutes-7]
MLKQLSVLIENKKGSLAEVTSLIKENDINIRAIAAFDTPDYGILRLIVDTPERAKVALEDCGYGVVLTDVIAVELEDEKGALNGILTVLEENDLQIEYIYSFVIRNYASPLMILKVNDLNEAINILGENKIKVASRNEIHK